ncbi:DUF1735 domain-containing protein [uncultured Alistipes sp.]|jgi:endo-beta-N-acetylglucosaminidase F1|uniref:BT_3987 domain-containing protein n=1 Tax=uncultured Alistipes sp. TaxID=538949 RepID=UPI0025D5ACA5|nr:DUF1735 domain-containing protein [uncultured Alistipes sp.]
MNTMKYLKRSILPVAMLFGSLATIACTDDIQAGKPVDEGAYEAVTRIDGMLLDVKSNKSESVIELRSEKYVTDVFFHLTKTPNKGVDVKIEVDPTYLDVYNTEHGTQFQLYPVDKIAVARDGVLVLAPDENNSTPVGVTLEATDGLQEGVTYVVPLRATTTTAGITLSEKMQHAVYLVKDLRSQSDTYKGPDAVTNVLYFEVNDTNPLNALEFVLADSGKLFFDHIILFSSNINWDAEKGRVYVYNNPNVQFLLDNNEEFLQPLRKRGMKVFLSILGNWDQSGVAQLSDMGCREYARELAAYCSAYNLDGVAFDDEYSEAPDLTNPWFTKKGGAAASRLLYETKKAIPDKLVMVYYLGSIYSSTIIDVDGIQPGDYVDYAVADYGGAAAPMKGMTLKNCAGMSIELAKGGGDSSEATARSRKAQGYGYYMFFALDPGKYASQVSRCRTVCKGLYDEDLLEPEYYYKKNDAIRYKR